jgi:hypothetical protein
VEKDFVPIQPRQPSYAAFTMIELPVVTGSAKQTYQAHFEQLVSLDPPKSGQPACVKGSFFNTA